MFLPSSLWLAGFQLLDHLDPGARQFGAWLGWQGKSKMDLLGRARRVGGLLGVAGRLSGTVSPFRAGVSSSCGARGGFLPRHDEDLREPLVRRQGSQVSMRVARGSSAKLPQLSHSISSA